MGCNRRQFARKFILGNTAFSSLFVMLLLLLGFLVCLVFLVFFFQFKCLTCEQKTNTQIPISMPKLFKTTFFYPSCCSSTLIHTTRTSNITKITFCLPIFSAEISKFFTPSVCDLSNSRKENIPFLQFPQQW